MRIESIDSPVADAPRPALSSRGGGTEASPQPAEASRPRERDPRRIAGSAFWRLVETGGTEGMSFVIFVVMARLLVPEQFGLVTLSSSILVMAGCMLNSGLPDALIQKDRLQSSEVRSVMGASLLFGLLLMAITVALIWPLSWLIHRPELPALYLAMAPILVVNGLAAPLHALARRKMNFRLIALRSLAGVAIGGLVGLLLAWRGAGVWALVAQQWCVAVIGFLVLLSRSSVRQWSVAIDHHVLEPLLALARPIIAGQFMSNAARRTDVLVLGLFLGDHAIGIYFLIARLLASVQLITQHSIGEIGLVVLSRLKDDASRHGMAARNTLRITTLACGLLFGTLALVADWLIPLMFGSDWRDAVRPCQVLAVLSTAGALVLVSGHILVSAGQPRPAARLSVIAALTQIAAMFLCASGGLYALALGIGLAQLLMVVPAFAWLARHVGVTLRELLRDQLPLVAGLALAGALAWASASSWPAGSVWTALMRAVVYLLLTASVATGVFRHEMFPREQTAVRWPRRHRAASSAAQGRAS